VVSLNKKMLMVTNEVIAEAAVRAGCHYFFGYPITPQNEIPEYLSTRLPEVGGVFLQAESEIAAINMVAGCAATGKRAMTSTSGPGVSLMCEGISFLACAEIPCLIVNIMRAGPGDGDITPSQGDYFQATKGGGHGDYSVIVLAPSSGQESISLVVLGFELSEKYRSPVIILGDALIGQMQEPVIFEDKYCQDNEADKSWALDGKGNKLIYSYSKGAEQFVNHVEKLQRKYKIIKQNEQRYEELFVNDAELLVVAFGSTSRIAKEAVYRARKEGMKIGLIRPITLWPFPDNAILSAVSRDKVKSILVVELNAGQMYEDVRLIVGGKVPVNFLGKVGGITISPNDIYDKLNEYL
jgi:2-oxoglutarate/2-oxoacid ferredoxin oxidoreductase subunit alpha